MLACAEEVCAMRRAAVRWTVPARATRCGSSRRLRAFWSLTISPFQKYARTSLSTPALDRPRSTKQAKAGSAVPISSKGFSRCSARVSALGLGSLSLATSADAAGGEPSDGAAAARSMAAHLGAERTRRVAPVQRRDGRPQRGSPRRTRRREAAPGCQSHRWPLLLSHQQRRWPSSRFG